MGKKFRNLIEHIADIHNLRLAYAKTSKAKRMTFGYLAFKEFAEVNLAELQQTVLDGTYRPGPYHMFEVYEPKRRLISALNFRDRVVQHALVAVIGPIFEATLLPRTFACREGMGTHAGVIRLQADMRHNPDCPYFVKTDFAKYFSSIDRAILYGLIEHKISCRATLDLIERFTPRRGVGIPIGNLTSQLWANVYGGLIDRHLQCDLGERLWCRYMDDIVVLGPSFRHMRDLQQEIARYSREHMGLELSKWMVGKIDAGVNFLGYRIWATHKLLRRQSVVRAKRKIRSYRDAGDYDRLASFLASWSGHAGWADTHHLMQSLGLEANDGTDN